jgi:hypothetical protein
MTGLLEKCDCGMEPRRYEDAGATRGARSVVTPVTTNCLCSVGPLCPTLVWDDENPVRCHRSGNATEKVSERCRSARSVVTPVTTNMGLNSERAASAAQRMDVSDHRNDGD